MYRWKILGLRVKPQEGEFNNVVAIVHWACFGEEEDHGAACYGTMSFSVGDSFVEFENLTQEQVLEWCYSNGIPKADVEAIVAKALINKVDKFAVQDKVPPWRADQQ
jgi:hypothetical protein